MKPLLRRVGKLEQKRPVNPEPIIAFHRVFGAKDGKPDGYEWLHSANALGFDLIVRTDDETENAFRQRVYGMVAVGKTIEEMTEEEMEFAMAVGNERLAMELAAEGGEG